MLRYVKLVMYGYMMLYDMLVIHDMTLQVINLSQETWPRHGEAGAHKGPVSDGLFELKLKNIKQKQLLQLNYEPKL